uniref:Uncharacterized protein n=1 Tax=Pantoea phage Survivor TaxID=3232176 RepID=A0AAU8KXU0_9CAUD
MIGKLLEIAVGLLCIVFGTYLFIHADIGSAGDIGSTIAIRVLTVILGLLGVFAIAFALFPKQIQSFMYGPADRKFF